MYTVLVCGNSLSLLLSDKLPYNTRGAVIRHFIDKVRCDDPTCEPINLIASLQGESMRYMVYMPCMDELGHKSHLIHGMRCAPMQIIFMATPSSPMQH